MQITITSGTGEGPTPTAAFDAALIQAGIANYNLLCLSSVIPPGAILTRGKFAAPSEEYGDRLYVVMARRIEAREGKAACAGLGWVQDSDTVTRKSSDTASAKIPMRLLRTPNGAKQFEFGLARPTGDGLDVIPRQAFLPESMDGGDKLIVRDVGAYSLALSSRFNGFAKPSVHFVD